MAEKKKNTATALGVAASNPILGVAASKSSSSGKSTATGAASAILAGGLGADASKSIANKTSTTAGTYMNSTYIPSDNVNLASGLKTTAENALANYGDFSYGKQSAYDQAMDAILNRDKFSYDLNGDALYQQYKDNYITQGKQASMDVMGQAAAMTGGYGNSYAQTVGQQTYQGYLQGLNDKVPELYQMALDRYNSEGDRLATNYSLLASDRANALSEHELGYNKLATDRDYYANNYDTEFNRDYSVWSNDRDYATQQEQIAYQKQQDAIANNLAIQQLNESIRANKASESLAWDKWNYQKNQPAAVDYAITNYSDIPSSVTDKLNKIVSAKVQSDGQNKFFILDPMGNRQYLSGGQGKSLSSSQKEAMKQNVSDYISGLVNAQQMSPALGDALMNQYMALIDK